MGKKKRGRVKSLEAGAPIGTPQCCYCGRGFDGYADQPYCPRCVEFFTRHPNLEPGKMAKEAPGC